MPTTVDALVSKSSRTKLLRSIGVFYVYEHWRPDTNTCFYVGKGFDKRAWEIEGRNAHYCAVLKKLRRLNLEVDVRIFSANLIETEALQLEIERIAFWKQQGVLLTNKTNGGEGVSGLKHSEATKLKLRMQRVGIPKPEHSLRLRGRKLSEETKLKIGLASLGHKTSEETRLKISKRNRGRIQSAEIREKLRLAHLGKKLPDEIRTKISLSGTQAWIDGKHKNTLKEIWSDPVRRAEHSAKLRAAKQRNPEAVKLTSKKGHHVRWHVNKGIICSTCDLCVN